jgi:adenylate kinase
VYREQTEPLIEFYRRRGLLREVDGDQPLAAVTGDIQAALATRV